MPRTVNVNYVTKEVKILLHDSETESLAAATAIAAAENSKVNAENAANSVTQANAILAAIRNEYGYPFTAATAADMTDTTKIYVYTGSETGYTNGNWYYYDGSAWVSGGVYNAVAFNTDPTLTISGAAADAKVTGYKIGYLVDPLRDITFSSDVISESLYITVNGTLNSGSVVRSIVVPLDKGTYKITKITSPIFRIGYTKLTVPAKGVILYGMQNLDTATTATITIDTDTSYLVITYYVNSAGYDYDAIFNSITIENVGHTAIDSYCRESAYRCSADTALIKESYPDEAYTRGAYTVVWEQGSIDNTTGADTSASSRIRTAEYIPVGEKIIGTFPSGANQAYWMRVYDENKNLMGTASFNADGVIVGITSAPSSVSYDCDIDTVADIDSDAKFVRFVVRNTDNSSITPTDNKLGFTIRRGSFTGCNLDDVYTRITNYEPYTSNEIVFMYDIGYGGYQTKGFLKLPSNYSPTGDPVPLVVVVHGSADVFALSATSMTDRYQTQYQFIRDNGYALFDCFGFGNKYPSGGCNTWGIPINNACYLSGIRYVCKKYNIDINNVFVSCKSLGGLQAFRMLMDIDFPIKAVGMLAPELWMLRMLFGYNLSDRTKIATELGFSADTNDVMNFTNATDPVPDGFYDYVTENMDKWCGIFTNFVGLPIVDADKPTYYRDASATSSMTRIALNRPLKIWISEDDPAVSYATASAVVTSLRNNGYNAILRTMPSGMGGHHSVDTDPNAPQTLNVTTKLGVTYATIPTAYYELVEFFEKYLSR